MKMEKKEAKEKINDWVNDKIEILGMDENTEKKIRDKIVKKLAGDEDEE
jgi:hypothetical protein